MVASIGHVGITRTDAINEYRVEQFLANGRVLSGALPASAIEQARTRLIDQQLLASEVSSYPASAVLLRRDALKQIAELRARFRSGRDFRLALRSLDVTLTQLCGRLERDQHILFMINARMRPAAAVSQREIQAYYEKTFLPEFSRLGRGVPPSLQAVQNRIREILVQKKINERLDARLKELSRERQVRILSQ